MGFYKQRESFLKQLAIDHPLVRHEELINPEDPQDLSKRQSFFRINDEDELLGACKNWIHFPCVVQMSLSGGDNDRDGSIRQVNSNTWLVLSKLQLDPENPVKADAITDVYDITFDVMQDLKKAVYDEYDENGGCGLFKRIEKNKFKWEQYGPVMDQLYGWILVFTDETKAFQ